MRRRINLDKYLLNEITGDIDKCKKRVIYPYLFLFTLDVGLCLARRRLIDARIFV